MRQITLYLILLISFTISAQPFQEFSSDHGIINPNVNCIEQGKSFVWIGTDRGLNRVVIKNNKVVKFSPRGTSVPVLSIEDDNDILWVGLKGKGVYKMPKNNYKFIGYRKDVLGNKEIIDIQKNSDVLRVTTKENTYEFDLKSDKYKVLKAKPTDDSKEFTLGGKQLKIINHKIFRYNEATKTQKRIKGDFKVNCGIPYNNLLIFGTDNGLQFYNPSMDTIKFNDPSISLKSVAINNKDTVAFKLQLPWDEYELKYNFEFIELGDPNQINVILEIKGPNDQIVRNYAASKPIVLNELEPGDYKITATAKNNLNIHSSNKLEFLVSIEEPSSYIYFQYFLVVLAIVIWSGLIIFFTRIKYKKDIYVLENALLEKTNKLNHLEKGQYGLVDEDEVMI